jgi:hypothetical protein
MYEDRIIAEGTVIVPDMGNCSIPLKSTDLKAAIKGIIADVEVIQTFYNDLDKKIEALYVFPLPYKSSVHSLKLKGDRIIKGEIREREEARKTIIGEHEKKIRLLEEERPILSPYSERIDVQEILESRLYGTIKYEDIE